MEMDKSGKNIGVTANQGARKANRPKNKTKMRLWFRKTYKMLREERGLFKTHYKKKARKSGRIPNNNQQNESTYIVLKKKLFGRLLLKAWKTIVMGYRNKYGGLL